MLSNAATLRLAIIAGYNNAGTMYRDAPGATQRAYQQNNLVQGNPSFPQGQMRTSSYNLAMQQGQASYQQHGQVVGMPQSQPQSQYTLNQHPSGRTVQIARYERYKIDKKFTKLRLSNRCFIIYLNTVKKKSFVSRVADFWTLRKCKFHFSMTSFKLAAPAGSFGQAHFR